MTLQRHEGVARFRRQIQSEPERGPELLARGVKSGDVDDDTLRRVIDDVWRRAEAPTIALGVDAWVALFRRAGFVGWQGAERPEGPITAYRGALPGHVRGMSWTTEVDRAQWFADRLSQLDPEAAVYEVTIPAPAVLAIIGDLDDSYTGNEAELIVDPALLPPPPYRRID